MKPEINKLNIIEEKTVPGEKSRGDSLEIAVGPELDEGVKTMGSLKDKLDHDRAVNPDDIRQIEKALGNLTVDVGGEKFSVEELKNNPELKINAEIWQEIAAGKFDRTNELTLLSVAAAAALAGHNGDLYLDGLRSLSVEVAMALAQHKGDLWLDGLKSLSPEVAAALTQHKDNILLRGIESLSEKVAKELAKRRGRLYIPAEIEKQVYKYRHDETRN